MNQALGRCLPMIRRKKNPRSLCKAIGDSIIQPLKTHAGQEPLNTIMGQSSRKRNEQRKFKAAIDNMSIERLEGLGDAIDLMHLAYIEDENGISNLMRCIRYIVNHHTLAEVVVMRREIANMGASRYVAGLAAEIGFGVVQPACNFLSCGVSALGRGFGNRAID